MTLSAFAADVPQPELQHMTAALRSGSPACGHARLSAGDRAALVKLIEAGRVVNRIFLQQLWEGNPALQSRLAKDKSALGKARLDYFWLNKSPWSDLDEHKAFLSGVPERKPLGANFYPENMTREKFEAWAKTLSPDARAQAEGFFTVIRRGADGQLRAIPYSEVYKSDLIACAKDLQDAAKLTDNASLKRLSGNPCRRIPLERLLRERCGVDGSGCSPRYHDRPLRDL